MRKYILILMFTLGVIAKSYSQRYEWVNFITPVNAKLFENEPTDMCTDAEGNIYVMGKHSKSITNGIDIAKIQKDNGVGSVYIAKYSKEGKPLWIKSMGSTSGDTPKYIKYTDGYLYVAAVFQGDPIYFNGNIITPGDYFFHIVKLTTDGDYKDHTSIKGLNNYFYNLAVIDDLLYILNYNTILVYNTDFKLQQSFTFKSNSFVILKDIVVLDKKNIALCGNFNNSNKVVYGDTTITDEKLEGKQYPAFIASLKTDGTLNWIQAFGRTAETTPMQLAVNPKTKTLYFAGMYTTAFTWQKKEFYVNRDDATNAFTATLSFDGTVKNHQVFLPPKTSTNRQIIINEIVAQQKGVYIMGNASNDILLNDKTIFRIEKTAYGKGFIMNMDAEGNLNWITTNGTAWGSHKVITGLATEDGGYFAASSGSGKEREYGCSEYDTLPGTALMYIANKKPSNGPDGKLSVSTIENTINIKAILDSYDTLYWTINGIPADTNITSVQLSPTESQTFTICLYAVSACGVFEACKEVNFTYKEIIQLHHAILSTGGDATNDKGSFSYSLGQVFYRQEEGENISLAEGVQQPYGITTKTAVPDAPEITLEMAVYPNPTSEFLFLTINDPTEDVYTIAVFDINGTKVFQQESTGKTTSFSLQHLPTGSYVLQLSHKSTFIKSYSIIKK